MTLSLDLKKGVDISEKSVQRFIGTELKKKFLVM